MSETGFRFVFTCSNETNGPVFRFVSLQIFRFVSASNLFVRSVPKKAKQISEVIVGLKNGLGLSIMYLIKVNIFFMACHTYKHAEFHLLQK
jgi:hypothetical protein